MKLFEEFKQEGEKYNERFGELSAEKETLEQKLIDLARQYEAGIEKDALGIAAFSDEKKVEDGMKKVREEIEKVNQKMDIVKRGKRQALTNKIPFLKEIRDREREEVDKEWEEGIEQLNRIKAEFLLAMVALGETASKGQKVFAEYTALMSEADPESREAKVGMTYTNYVDEQTLKFNFGPFTKHVEDVLSVPGEASKAAYRGNIPNWVQHYATTGEIKL